MVSRHKFFRRLVLLTAVILPAAAIVGESNGAMAQPKPQGGAAQEKPVVSPSRLYEAVSGYVESFKRGPVPKRRERSEEDKYRSKPAPQQTTRNEEAVFESDKRLGAKRADRGEWNLALLSFERALGSNVRMAASEKERLEGMIHTAQEKSQSIEEKFVGGELTNSIGMRLAVLRPDEFEMGSSPAEIRRIRNEWNADENILQAEQPNHKVRISRPFLMGKYPVTVGEFKKFVSETGYRTTAEKQGWAWGYDESKKHWTKNSGLSWKKSAAKWDDHPVTCVSSLDAEAFCDWLSRRENRRYYLPTEAQWEVRGQRRKGRRKVSLGEPISRRE